MYFHLLITNRAQSAFMDMALLLTIGRYPNVTDAFKKGNELNQDSRSILNQLLTQMGKPTSSSMGGGMLPTSFFGKPFSSSLAKIEEVIEELAPTLQKISSLSEEQKNDTLIEAIIEQLFVWKDSDDVQYIAESDYEECVDDFPHDISRTILLELYYFALTNDFLTDSSRKIIQRLAQKLEIATSVIEEIEQFCVRYQKLFSEGIAIIGEGI